MGAHDAISHDSGPYGHRAEEYVGLPHDPEFTTHRDHARTERALLLAVALAAKRYVDAIRQPPSAAALEAYSAASCGLRDALAALPPDLLTDGGGA